MHKVKKEDLLLLESTLTNTILLEGLDCLSNANIYVKGLYYQAFFSLSNGIERLLKLIIIEDYRGKNNKIPDNNYLRNFKHDIYKMIELYIPSLLENEVNEKVIRFLSNYAKKTRYYNLDVLTGKNSNYINPIEEWSIIEELIINKYSMKYNKIENKKLLASMLDEIASINFKGMKLEDINSSHQILDEYEERWIKQGGGVLVCFRIIQTLASKLDSIEKEYNLYPYLWEVFRYIRGNYNDDEIITKKNWIELI